MSLETLLRKVAGLGTGLLLLTLALSWGTAWLPATASSPAPASAPAEPAPLPSSALPEAYPWVRLAETLKPAVVNISTTRVVQAPQPGPGQGPGGPQSEFFEEFFRRFFGERMPREFRSRSLGSGFIVDPDGYIVTNHHVIAQATEITVQLASGETHPAEVVGRDPKTDLALLRVKASGLPVIRWGDSSQLRVAEPVMAIGNPFGLDHTVTVGIVSATGRVIGAGPYDNFIQTDAAINPGNSGGPLINTRGEAVGIASAIFSARGGGFMGIGFAIPSDTAKSVISQLKEHGRVVRGYLGVAVQPLTPELAKAFGLEKDDGALVAAVQPGSPAAEAGLRRGDVIIEYDGKPIGEIPELPRLVAATPIGKEVAMKILREGQPQTLSVKIGELREEEVAAREGEGRTEKTELGLRLEELTPELAQRLGVERREGVVITAVQPGSPAAEAGLRPGDLVVEVNRQKVKRLKDVEAALAKRPPAEGALFLVEREGAGRYVVLKTG